MQCQEVSDHMKPADFDRLTSSDFPAADAIYQRVAVAAEPKTANLQDIPKKFGVFNADCLLPEYLVEYSLESDFEDKSSPCERLLLDIAYSNRISHANMPTVVNELLSKTKQADPETAGNSPTLEKLVASHSDLVEFSDMRKFVNRYSLLLQNSDNRTNQVNLSGFTSLPPEYFAKYSNLTSITINHAELASFPNFPLLPALESLDLSYNVIAEIPPFLAKHLPKLKRLLLASNRIHASKDVQAIGELAKLVELDVRFNPIWKSKEMELLLAFRLVFLETLNGQKLKEDHRRQQTSSKDPAVILQSRISDQSESFRPFSLRTQYGAESSSLEQNYYSAQLPRYQRQSITIDAITTLELDNCQLTSLALLPETLPNLKWASFRNNFLDDISKLANYTNLEELSVEKNDIASIDCLAALPVLSKLDASSNRIVNIENASFKSLTFLSLEKNQFKSLRPFSKISSLFELYVGDNNIAHSFTTFPLKELPRLIILDLTGNPVCKLPNFRLFTIFHLNRLKILNGNGVTVKDQNQAREMYMGKLTVELLGEKIGHFNFKNITELDLRNCKIKEID
ncbi:hypothetical protein HDU91_001371, partial [Kappamyces sp. JEL0680]